MTYALKTMICTSGQKNANSNKKRLSTWDWLSEKEKSTWILAKWKRSEPGPPLNALGQSEVSLGSQISIVDSSRTFQRLPDPYTI